MSSENNKRIAKNTGMLYIRMLLTMTVSLYTSRIVLHTLGVEDFGIYNVVGGFVSMFGFLNNSMASATQRFLSFEIGKNDYKQLHKVFNMSVNIHFVIALVILLLAETVGLWFVNTQLTIPAERTEAAKWIYQFSIFTFLVGVVSVPYNAAIIAHERMNVFAIVSVIEVSLKLALVFMLQLFEYDSLKMYAILMFGVSLILRLIYGFYCSRNFPESKFKFFWEQSLFKTLMSYAAWNLWGNAASVLYGQGVNILLNIYFGPIVNAARGISYQLSGAANHFVQNFQTAINPQIIKSYASNDIKYMHKLILQGAKYSFFLLFTLSLPILLETEIILYSWLKIVPQYTVLFTQLIIINVLTDSISRPLMTAAQATGKIKLYQGVVGGLLLLILPISYIFFKLKYPPQITFYVSITISVVALFARLLILRPLIQLRIKIFLKETLFKNIVVALMASIIPLFIKQIMEESFLRFIIVSIFSMISTLVTIFFIGLKENERLFILQFSRKQYNRLFNKH